MGPRPATHERARLQLIAYAHAHGHTVATHEKSRPEAKKTIMIPDACKALGVDCVDPFRMLRDEKARFVLAETSRGERDSRSS
ncbi:MAG: DUF4411 family protein [Propionibacteriaceae bacterium]|nr:DUF4411 family protein [Propionibacteriaceae bacterium]